MKRQKNFWDRNAGRYDRFMRKDAAAYAQRYELRSRWSSNEYLTFLRKNGWTVRKSAILTASFPLTYAECVKSEG